jgi:hypothetical protein
VSTDIQMLDQFGEEMANLPEATNKRLDSMFYQINTNLGGTSIEVHLNDEDYRVAFKNAVDEYRYSSGRSFHYTYGNLILEPGKQHYVLHRRVDTVQRIYRGRGLMLGAANGVFDSFGQAMLNSILSGNANLGGTGGSGTFDLVSYETFVQYTTLMNKMFARDLAFRFNKTTSTLTIYQWPRTQEMVAIQVSVSKTIPELVDDQFSWNWLRKYTEAQARLILGEKYTLYATLPSAQGGATLKGERLIQQGTTMVEQLQKDIQEYADGGEIAYPVRG